MTTSVISWPSWSFGATKPNIAIHFNNTGTFAIHHHLQVAHERLESVQHSAPQTLQALDAAITTDASRNNSIGLLLHIVATALTENNAQFDTVLLCNDFRYLRPMLLGVRTSAAVVALINEEMQQHLHKTESRLVQEQILLASRQSAFQTRNSGSSNILIFWHVAKQTYAGVKSLYFGLTGRSISPISRAAHPAITQHHCNIKALEEAQKEVERATLLNHELGAQWLHFERGIIELSLLLDIQVDTEHERCTTADSDAFRQHLWQVLGRTLVLETS